MLCSCGLSVVSAWSRIVAESDLAVASIIKHSRLFACRLCARLLPWRSWRPLRRPCSREAGWNATAHYALVDSLADGTPGSTDI